MGDRTLAVFMCADMQLATYTWNNPNVFTNVQLGEYEGFWTYIYMGYSREVRRVSYFIGYPDITKQGHIEEVLHFYPKYLALYIGRDTVSTALTGLYKLVTINVGPESYFNTKKEANVHKLENYLENKLNNKYSWHIEEDEQALVTSPSAEPILDLVLDSSEDPALELEGINEYGFGVWTRWMMTQPPRLMEKADMHSVIRMASTRVYQDKSKLGNRVLAVFVAKAHYLFSTYDSLRAMPDVFSTVEYRHELEGYWNFLYFGYKRFLELPRAVGYVAFSHSGDVRRVEIQNAKHYLLRDYARFVVGTKEFSYLPFQGHIFDLRIQLGQGAFISTSDELISAMQAYRSQPKY